MTAEARTRGPSPHAAKGKRLDPASLPWIRLLPLLGLLASVAVSALYGMPTGLVVIGAVLLLTGIWNLWTSLQVVAGDRPAPLPPSSPEALSREQEQKAFLLRALEDLEYERSVGKIDDEDYESFRRQYRERAKRALSAGNEGADPHRRRAEALALAYLESQGLRPATTEAPDEARPAADEDEDEDDKHDGGKAP